MHPLRNTERVLNNKAVERNLAVEKIRSKPLTFDDVAEDVVGGGIISHTETTIKSKLEGMLDRA